MFGVLLHYIKFISVGVLKFERVNARFLEPVICPSAKVSFLTLAISLHRLVKALDQVFESRVLVRKPFHVLGEALLDDAPAYERVHCFDPARSLLIRNRIKCGGRITSVFDINLDWVSSWPQICIECPCREHKKEKLGFWVALSQTLRLAHASHRAEVCETFLQPEVVPPVHGRKVTKPHVSQLMQVNVGVHQISSIGSLIRGFQDPICESYGANVLHGANPELRHVDHVVFGEGKVVSKELAVEVNTLLNRAEDLSRVEVVKLALGDEDSHRRRYNWCFILNDSIVTCTDAVNIRANRRAFFEVPKISISAAWTLKVVFFHDALGFS